MKDTYYIALPELCTHYKIEMSFIDGLKEYGLIETTYVEKTLCLHRDHIADVEKMIRMHQDLNLNLEGIDTVLNLLEKIDALQQELAAAKNQLKRFEDI